MRVCVHVECVCTCGACVCALNRDSTTIITALDISCNLLPTRMYTSYAYTHKTTHMQKTHRCTHAQTYTPHMLNKVHTSCKQYSMCRALHTLKPTPTAPPPINGHHQWTSFKGSPGSSHLMTSTHTVYPAPRIQVKQKPSNRSTKVLSLVSVASALWSHVTQRYRQSQL